MGVLVSSLFVLFLSILCSLLIIRCNGYMSGSSISSMPFNQLYRNLWGPQHQTLDQSGTLTIWLDRSSGSGFKSLQPYASGYFGANIKLQPGYTAGVITSLYLSNGEAHPGDHDEIDIEFLGTTQDKPYVLQTNVYMKGSGDGRIIGREVKFHLWFDPTKDFHHYAILWNPSEIIFFVDNVPIRRYPKKSEATFPTRPMWVYGSIWDASSWATENGRYKADYSYQPFVAKYNGFKIGGGGSGGLSGQQAAAMANAQNRYKIYDYCRDSQRDHSLTPECYN